VRRLAKAVMLLLIGTVLAWLVVAVTVHVYYSASLSQVPDEKAGYTNRVVVNHGFIRYASERESRALRDIENFAPIAAFMFLGFLTLFCKFGCFGPRIKKGKPVRSSAASSTK
jgi:hypothetical protein